MKHSQLVLSYENSLDFLNKIMIINHNFIYNKSEKIFQYTNTSGDLQCKIKFPPLFFAKKNELMNLIQAKSLRSETPSYLILLIRAGQAALGFSQNGVLIYHKVIKKYMVRKKQGKAQLTYQALRGKARGGAKLRLSRTQEFFEEINSKLNDWQDSINKAQWILFQCSPRLWSGLFKIKISPTFSKKDERLQKIPFTTYKPTYSELQRINRLLLQATITIISQTQINSIEELIPLLLTTPSH